MTSSVEVATQTQTTIPAVHVDHLPEEEEVEEEQLW
jgi:hypothetical protein